MSNIDKHKKTYPETIEDDIWIPNYTCDGGVIYTKKNEDHSQNNSESIQKLESDQNN
jgi:hypothetical protein